MLNKDTETFRKNTINKIIQTYKIYKRYIIIQYNNELYSFGVSYNILLVYAKFTWQRTFSLILEILTIS